MEAKNLRTRAKKITKEEFDKVKTLVEKGFSISEIETYGFVKLSIASLYKINRYETFEEFESARQIKNENVNVDKTEQTTSNIQQNYSREEMIEFVHKANKYDIIVELLFSSCEIHKKETDTLFFYSKGVGDFLKMSERMRYIDKLEELNKDSAPMWFNKNTKKYEYK